MRIFFSGCIILLFAAASCRTQKQVVNNYIQDAHDTTIKDSILFKQPVIQKGDLLAIRVYSIAMGVDPRVDAGYNLPDQSVGADGTMNTSGILVDEDGNIEYPQIGVIHAEGLTREQLAATIKKKLEGQLNQPSVIVRFLNYRITVLGEVGRPGTFNAPTERINVFEAIGMAGDITEYGIKRTVKIYREVNGERQIGTLDLTSKEVFNSPFYRLQQNDIVMVEQSSKKVKQRERQDLAQQIGIASSIITAIALILNLIK
jgi:polysaccharide export outer membrane protein